MEKLKRNTGTSKSGTSDITLLHSKNRSSSVHNKPESFLVHFWQKRQGRTITYGANVLNPILITLHNFVRYGTMQNKCR